MSSTLAAIQAESRSKLEEEKKHIDRKREILYLIHEFLESNNLVRTSEVLENEANLTNKHQVADNIDLTVSNDDSTK